MIMKQTVTQNCIVQMTLPLYFQTLGTVKNSKEQHKKLKTYKTTIHALGTRG